MSARRFPTGVICPELSERVADAHSLRICAPDGFKGASTMMRIPRLHFALSVSPKLVTVQRARQDSLVGFLP